MPRRNGSRRAARRLVNKTPDSTRNGFRPLPAPRSPAGRGGLLRTHAHPRVAADCFSPKGLRPPAQWLPRTRGYLGSAIRRESINRNAVASDDGAPCTSGAQSTQPRCGWRAVGDSCPRVAEYRNAWAEGRSLFEADETAPAARREDPSTSLRIQRETVPAIVRSMLTRRSRRIALARRAYVLQSNGCRVLAATLGWRSNANPSTATRLRPALSPSLLWERAGVRVLRGRSRRAAKTIRRRAASQSTQPRCGWRAVGDS